MELEANLSTNCKTEFNKKILAGDFFVCLENHESRTKYDDALILKLFGFQFVNSYASLFYIAFFRQVFISSVSYNVC